MNGKHTSNHGSRNGRDGLESRPDVIQKSRKTKSPDFEVENHGTIFLLRPISDAARAWVSEHIGQDNGYQPYYPTIVVEHRYIADIIAGIQGDRLAVQS